jgi:hypothetical protein
MNAPQRLDQRPEEGGDIFFGGLVVLAIAALLAVCFGPF